MTHRAPTNSGRSGRYLRASFISRISHVPIILETAALVFLAAGCGKKTASPAADNAIHEMAFVTMGRIEARFKVYAGKPNVDVQALMNTARARVERVNTLMNHYDPSSEIARLSNATADHPIPLSDETIAVLSLCRKLYTASGGAFDPTVGPLEDLYGFKKETGPHWPSDAELAKVMTKVGFDKVHIDPKTNTGWVDSPGLCIDLGAVAKGYAVDRAAEVFVNGDVTGYMVDIGGELRVFGSKPNGVNWVGGIQHPRKVDPFSDTLLAKYEFRAPRALATSGDYRQYIMHEGRRFSHIIDARTGRPLNDGAISVSVFAPTCAVADGLATAVSVIGYDAGLKMLKQFADVDLLVIEETRPGNGKAPDYAVRMTDSLKNRLDIRW